MCLNEFEAHSVCMLFSGAGVPLIGVFQGVAFCIRSENAENIKTTKTGNI